MRFDINDGDLKYGLLGLAVAILEIIRDTLRIQSIKRVQSGALAEDEIDRLGRALMDLDMALEKLKEEQGVAQLVRSIRDGLDEVVTQMVEMASTPSDVHGATRD